MRASPWSWSSFSVLALLALGCGQDGRTTPARAKQADAPLYVFVAASTKEATQEIADAFTKEKGGAIKINADDSSKLATQITQEAPAHLFLSANEKWATHVQDKGFGEENVKLLGNRLVIVAPKDNPAALAKADDLKKTVLKKIAIAGPTVPAGIYARQALKTLGLWTDLEKSGKVVSGENVRFTMAFVERGEVEAGIVYATDAKISKQVEVVAEFDAKSHDPIHYPLVLLKSGATHAQGRAFYDFLRGPGAAAIFERYGFVVLTH